MHNIFCSTIILSDKIFLNNLIVELLIKNFKILFKLDEIV
jgi:hypothetical protein